MNHIGPHRVASCGRTIPLARITTRGRLVERAPPTAGESQFVPADHTSCYGGCRAPAADLTFLYQPCDTRAFLPAASRSVTEHILK